MLQILLAICLILLIAIQILDIKLDYNKVTGTILWYTNLKGQRKYLNLG